MVSVVAFSAVATVDRVTVGVSLAVVKGRACPWKTLLASALRV